MAKKKKPDPEQPDPEQPDGPTSERIDSAGALARYASSREAARKKREWGERATRNVKR